MMAKISVCFFLVTLSVVGQSKKELLSQLKEKENQINSLKIENEKLTVLNDKLRIIHVNQLEAVKSELLKLVLSLEESKKSIEIHDISENTKNKLTDSYVSTSQSSSINSSSPSSTYSPPANSYNSRSSSSNRTIHTGPRGGRYYINSNGNKTYVKKK